MRFSDSTTSLRNFLVAGAFLLNSTAYSQIVFCSTTNGGGNTFSHDVVTCSNGNYITAGKSGQEMYLTKTSNAGTLIWTRHYAAGTDDEIYGAIETFDQKLVICGSFMTASNLQDYFISKLDQSGNIIWSHSYGSSSSDDAFAVYETSDYGYIVTGQTFSFGQGHYDVFVTKLDSAGNITWSKIIGEIGEDKGYDVIETADGGYAIAGFSAPLFCAPRAAAYVLKLDANGNLLWTQAIGTTVDSHWFTGIVEGDDGKLYCGGRGTSSGGISYFLLSQVDQVSGTVLWSRYIGSSLQQQIYEDAFSRTTDSCLIIGGGYSTSNSIIAKINYQGTVQWATKHASLSGFHDIELSSLGGFVGSGDNFYLTQMDSTGNSCCSDTANIISFLTTFTIAAYGIPDTVMWNSSALLNLIGGSGTMALNCRTCAGLSIDADAIDPTICVGDTTTVFVNVTSFATGFSYLWQPGGATTSSVVVSPGSDQTYTVTVTDSLGICSTFDTVSVRVYPLAYIDGDTLMCRGDSVLLSAHGGGLYDWGSGPSTIANVWVRPNTTTTYSVTVTDVNMGCSQTVYYTVNVDSCTTDTYCKLSGVSLAQYGYDVVATYDGGSVVAADRMVPPANSIHPYIVKYNGRGDYVWGYALGGNSGNAKSIIQLPDSGYVMAGEYYNFAGNYDFLVARLNKHGVLQWAHNFGGSSYDFGEAIVLTADTGLLLVGESGSFGGIEEAIAVRMDLDGNILWTRKYGGSARDGATDVVTTTDGGFVITGSTTSFGAGGSDLYAIRTDSAGVIIWTKTIGGPLADTMASVAASDDGGFVIAGSTHSYGAGTIDFYAAKLDSSGNLLWAYTYGTSVNQFAYDISPTPDSGFIITGRSYNTSQSYSNSYLVKIDRNGTLQWALSTPTVGYYSGYSSAAYEDGSIITTGNFDIIGGVYITLSKTDPNQNSCCLLPVNCLQSSGGIASSGGTSSVVTTGFAVITGWTLGGSSLDSCLASIPTEANSIQSNQSVSVFPNPASTEINFTTNYSITEIQIYNTHGQLIATALFTENTTAGKISTSALTPGVYILRMLGEEEVHCKKIVVESQN